MVEQVERKRRLRLPALPGSAGSRSVGLALMLVVLPVLYWGIYPLIAIHTIDDDPNFAPAEVPAGSSHAVAAAAALIDREINRHEWVANDPFFAPTALLDNMPNYQVGIVYALGRFAIEMSDQIGRARGTSQVDPDLDNAAGRLKFPGNVWWIDFSVSTMMQSPSEEQYREALKALESYNARLAAGDERTVFERRSDNLLATLERFAADIGSASAQVDDMMGQSSLWIFEGRSDDVFYANKGRIYAYYILLRALGEDFEQVIRDRQLEAVWSKLLDGMRVAAEMQPWFVLNAPPDGMIFPNHLAAQGFYLVRARTQLKEVTNILLK